MAMKQIKKRFYEICRNFFKREGFQYYTFTD